MNNRGPVSRHAPAVTKELRREQNGHSSFVLWFTGLSGSGKSTVANAVSRSLHERGIRTYVLDGDNLRGGLNRDLGFSLEDRRENIRRTGEVAKLLVDSGIVVLAALISPLQEDRDRVRRLFETREYAEIHVNCPLEECEQRDPKGLYAKARAGGLTDFTGIHSPYEEPLHPELVLDTRRNSPEGCAAIVLEYLSKEGLLI